MDVLFFILACITFIMGYTYYFRFIIKSNEKNPIPWIIWSLLGFDIMLNVMLSTNTHLMEKIINISFFIGPLAIAIVLIKSQGIKKLNKGEIYYISITLFFLIAIISVRYKGGIENIDTILTTASILLELFIIFPILKEIYQHPNQEDIKPWFYWLLSTIFAIIAIGQNHSFSGIGLVIYILVVCSIITMYLFYHKNLKKVTC